MHEDATLGTKKAMTYVRSVHDRVRTGRGHVYGALGSTTKERGSVMDPNELSPGIRDLVIWLNSMGFQTTDSGDGTNFREGMECAVPYPMVAMRTSARHMVQDARRLRAALMGRSVDLNRKGIAIEASYSPIDDVAILVLTGVLSSDIKRQKS